MLETYVKKILSSKVYDLAKETPLSPARLLTQRFGTQVYLKREDLHSIFSFKFDLFLATSNPPSVVISSRFSGTKVTMSGLTFLAIESD